MIRWLRSDRSILIPGVESAVVRSGTLLFQLGRFRFIWSCPLNIEGVWAGQRFKRWVFDVTRLAQIALIGGSVLLLLYTRSKGVEDGSKKRK